MVSLFLSFNKSILIDLLILGYHHGYHGKREAEAEPGYVHAPCEKVKKEVCKSVPVKADVSKDIESCTEVAKEVCEEVDKVVPKVTCKKATIKH